MAVQLYLALICMVDGNVSSTLMGAFLMFTLASIYSFFNPVHVLGIDALQSNGAMLALMGGSTYSILTAGAGMPFFLLFSLLAVDCMASFSSYFQNHAQTIEWAGPSDPLNVINNPKGNDNDYSRL